MVTEPAVRQGRVLLVLSAAAFMASMDLFIVNVAFEAIGRDFRAASLPDLSWVLNGYAIVYAAMLVPLGRLADRYGRKEGFLAGLGLFVIASAACALSPGLWWLVAFRLLQATGAAALTPTSLALLLRATEPSRRSRAVRIWAATGALAAAIGPVVGGLLVQASWQWVFVVNIPIGLAAMLAAVRWVPDSRDGTVERRPDLAGAALLALAVAAVALSVVKGPEWGQLLVGAGVGFALPTILSSGTAELPPARSATGSAVLNMNRQIGAVLGVSVLVAVLGSPAGFAEAHHAFRVAWVVVAVAAAVAAFLSLGMSPSRDRTSAVPAAELS